MYEACALNEAYADIIGNLIEGDLIQNDAIGEGFAYIKDKDGVSILTRSFSDPNKQHKAAVVGDKYWGKSKDGGTKEDIYANATVLDHAAYLMAKEGLDGEDLAKLWHKSIAHLQQEGHRNHDFWDCKKALLSTVAKYDKDDEDLKDKHTAIINKAFNSVGINVTNYGNKWFSKDMKIFFAKQFSQLREDGTLDPTLYMTKADFISAVAFAYQCDIKSTYDVEVPSSWENHVQCNSLKYALNNNWIDNTINPDEYITREEAMHYLWQAFLAEESKIADILRIKEYSDENSSADIKKRKKDFLLGEACNDKNDISKEYLESICQLYLNKGYSVDRDDIGNIIRPKDKLTYASGCVLIMQTVK